MQALTTNLLTLPRRCLKIGVQETRMSKKPNRRLIALETIRIDVARHGKMTTTGMRAYVENKVSHAAMLEAAAIGLRQFNARKPK